MQRAKVILISVLAAIAYGIIHDLITAHLCVEYFSVVHPPLFHTKSPSLLAIYWGSAATCWIGACFGAVLALVSQSGDAPSIPLPRLGRSILILLIVMSLLALVAGAIGFVLCRFSILSLPSVFSELIPTRQHNRFMAVWFAHIASYLAGFAGSTVLILHIWRERGKPRCLALYPRTKLEVIRALALAAVVAAIAYWRFTRS